ncbi:calcium/proton antiporter, CaCA family [Paenibacillus thiaminolyticus]|nr:calcium/proton antiporter, CaCA family [Paenibacillus thiaminolyticus]
MGRRLFFIILWLTFILSAAGHYQSWNMTLQFALSALAIVLVSGFLGRSTEAVSHYAGQRLGGFLNATFGNTACRSYSSGRSSSLLSAMPQNTAPPS